MNDKFQEMSDGDLLNKLESAEMFARVLESAEWGAFREAWKRIHDLAQTRLSLIDPVDVSGIIKEQYAVRFYDNVLETTIKQMQSMSDIAYAEAKERGLVNRFVEKIRSNLGFLASRK